MLIFANCNLTCVRLLYNMIHYQVTSACFPVLMFPSICIFQHQYFPVLIVLLLMFLCIYVHWYIQYICRYLCSAVLLFPGFIFLYFSSLVSLFPIIYGSLVLPCLCVFGTCVPWDLCFLPMLLSIDVSWYLCSPEVNNQSQERCWALPSTVNKFENDRIKVQTLYQ